MEENQLLAKLVKELRTQRAWTQEQLAGAANLSPRTVQRLEVGDKPSAETLMSIADAFGIEVAVLTEPTRLTEQSTNKDANDQTLDQAPKAALGMLKRIRVGQELLSIVTNYSFHKYECDILHTRKEAKLAGRFFDEILHASDFLDGFLSLFSRNIYKRTFNYGLKLTKRIEQLEKDGFLVFAGFLDVEKTSYDGSKNSYQLRFNCENELLVPCIYLVKTGNPKIIHSDDGRDLFPVIGTVRSSLTPLVTVPPYIPREFVGEWFPFNIILGVLISAAVLALCTKNLRPWLKENFTSKSTISSTK